jgi:hypothetical protein
MKVAMSAIPLMVSMKPLSPTTAIAPRPRSPRPIKPRVEGSGNWGWNASLIQHVYASRQLQSGGDVRALFTGFVVATIFIGTIVSTAEPMVTGVNAITLTNTIESRYVRHESGHA